MGSNSQDPYLQDDAPDDNSYGGADQMLAQAPMAPPSPFPVARTQSNVQKQFQNLADASTVPGNKQVYNQGKSNGLFNAVTDFANGAMSASDLQGLIKTITTNAQKTRQGLDSKNQSNLTSLAGLTKILGNAGVEDIDALAEAVMMHKTMQQADSQFQQSAQATSAGNIEQSLAPFLARGGASPNAPGTNQGIPAQADMIGQVGREGRQMYLNAHGIQEFGAPQQQNGQPNYHALDSWQAIAHDRDAERTQFKQQLGNDMQAGLEAHLRAAQTAQTQSALAQAMALATGQQSLRKGEEELKLMPEESKANAAYKNALANPRARMLEAAAKIWKEDPEAGKALMSQLGYAPPAQDASGNSWWNQIKGALYKQPQQQGQAGEQKPKDFGGSVEIPKPEKAGAQISQDVVNKLKQRFGSDKAAAIAEAKRLGYKL